MQLTNRVPWSPRFPGITKQCFLIREHNDSAVRGQLATLVRFVKTLRGWRASTTQQESDLRYVLKQVKPRQELGLLALAVEIKPPSQPLQNTVNPPSPQPFQKRSHPTQPLHSMVKPAQAHPKPTRKLPSAPSKHGQTHPSPVKAWSKPPQSHPTFKTPSNPPHPPAPLLNRPNPPRVHKTRSNPPQSIQSMVKPSQTHPKPTLNPPQTHPLFSVPSKHGQTHSTNPRAQPCRWGRRPPPGSSSSLGAWITWVRPCP